MQEPLYPWPELTRGILIERQKTFTARVLLDDGSLVRAHCPNTGRMLTCSEPLRPVYLAHSTNPGRSTSHTWEMIEMPGSLVVVDTMVANRLALAAVCRGRVPELACYETARPEVAFHGRSRFDLLLEAPGKPGCIVEVKSSTLVEDGVAMFPDAVSKRALAHVEELGRMGRLGFRTVMLFLIMRNDALAFRPASHVDPAFCRALSAALGDGLEVMAYRADVGLAGVSMGHRVPVQPW
ncbi:MAG TPA: DNA/RNA nuclease SfsA [Deltaproteobacteria bacterium]|nr:DNA/RNA nuclease SfsA [Deltaproteobacteria bacterium]HOM28880.1 DNA/RNA nuclease SfsA [Deltaproteobacteria bacterium]HPP80774.1 DNA/RNA nuclease SfsA [Deltaproteobacteria bacterium]